MKASDLPKQSIPIGEFQHARETIERGDLILNAISAVLKGRCSGRIARDNITLALEQLRSIKRPKTRTSCEVLDDFSTFYRAQDAIKG